MHHLLVGLMRHICQQSFGEDIMEQFIVLDLSRFLLAIDEPRAEFFHESQITPTLLDEAIR